jgi:glycosyltransferase involved in cell wall biosynthesis
MKILFVTGATHKAYMVNLNHYQRVFFLSRSSDFTILSGKNSDFSISAKPGTRIVNSPWKGKWGLLLYSIVWFIKTGKKENFDIVLTEPSMLCLAGFFMRVLSASKWVVDVWDIPIRNQSHSTLLHIKTTVQRYLFKFLFKWTDMFIMSIIPDLEFKMFSVPENKLLKLKNAIWINNEGNGKAEDKLKDGFNILCMRSRYSQDSGLEILAEAFRRLSQNVDDVTLTIVGKIPEDMMQKISFIENTDNVRLFDFVEHDILLNMIKESTVCIIPYRDTPDLSQIYPVKLLEYLAMGTVVLAADLAGLKSIISDGYNGLLFEAGNVENMFDKLTLLYEQPELRESISNNAITSSKEYDCVSKNKIIIDELEKMTATREIRMAN